MPTKKDYSENLNKKYGRLLIIRIFKDGYQIKCECLCDCGKIKVCSINNVLKGKSTSCGCYQKERAIDANKKENRYDLSGNYGVGYTNNGVEFYFDLEDYSKIKEYCWCYKKNGYIFASQGHQKSPIMLHRLLSDFPDSKIDHVNRNKIDCRKENLRLADNFGNSRNSLLRKNNKSGFIGIRWCKQIDKWESYITVNWKRIYLGIYDDSISALISRLKAEKEYFGEFAPQRHLFSEYGIQD